MNKLTEKQLATLWQEIEIQPNTRVVLLDTMSDRNIIGDECNRNIYRINQNNEIIWQVRYPPNTFEEDPIREFSDPFVSIGYYPETRKIHANKSCGNEYEIDVTTGKAKHTGWHK